MRQKFIPWVVVAGIPMLASADNISYIFAPNTLVKSAELNANFATLDEGVEKNSTDIDTLFNETYTKSGDLIINGKLDVGLDAPSTALEVHGTIFGFNGLAPNKPTPVTEANWASYKIYEFASDNWSGIGAYTDGMPWIRNGLDVVGSDGLSKLRVTNEGSVGIGTSSPGAPLVVVSDATNAVQVWGKSTNSVAYMLNNYVEGGHSWSVASSGGDDSPVGSFVIYDNTIQKPRLILSPDGDMDVQGILSVGDGGVEVGNNQGRIDAYDDFDALSFTKPRDELQPRRYTFTDVGGLPSDSSGGAFWRGFHLQSPSIVEGGLVKFPRLGVYSEYDSLIDPMSKVWVVEASNTPGTAHDIDFRIEGKGSVLRLDRTGNVGFGKTDPSYPIELASGAYVTQGGVWKDASSRKYKENIRDLSYDEARSTLAKLSPKQFRYRAEPGEEYLGFIAEDVPELVASRDRRSLSPMDIVAVLTKNAQRQQQEIAVLKAECSGSDRHSPQDLAVVVGELQSENTLLKARLDRLEQLLLDRTAVKNK